MKNRKLSKDQQAKKLAKSIAKFGDGDGKRKTRLAELKS